MLDARQQSVWDWGQRTYEQQQHVPQACQRGELQRLCSLHILISVRSPSAALHPKHTCMCLCSTSASIAC